MSIFNPVIWVPWIPWLGFGYVAWDALSSGFDGSRKLLVGVVYFVIYLLASFWQGQVTEIVPEPYLDEIFHIPQAQAYCTGDFHIWDPKLTTPPGLYAFTTLFGNLGGIRTCNVYTLRFFNTLVLIATMAYASDCRTLITRAWKRESKDSSEESEQLSPNVMHTAINIALFPPLFFFSGLFYTDVLSTCVVLRMYRLFLQRKGSVWLYLAGILALTMRQTNIFWVAIFMGGLEVVRTTKSIDTVPMKKYETQTWKEIAISESQRYSRGEIHDLSLKDAEIYDYALCAVSIAVVVLYHPIRALQKLWPYIALLLSFAGFVFWNGGVVLGDKSNHVATIHLPQLLYLSAFTAFFSFPLLIPSLITLLRPFLALLLSSLRSPSGTSTPLWKLILNASVLLGSTVVIVLAIHFNTLIHPFTLADNRHYIFYVFRYTILFHPLIRYLLTPIYILCIWLSYRTLSTPSSKSPNPSKSSPAAASSKTASNRTEIHARMHTAQGSVNMRTDTGPTTSFLLIFLLSTTLSLITAPLVEPRYFIIPWVVWRLHVPSYTSSPASSAGKGGRRSGKRAAVKFWAYKGYDYRLWIETAWFLGINAATGYVFLYRGFEWLQEPGAVQRFMW